ncbi:MAG TPA: serine hydrolase [Longimicrobiaceae bacterium]|nr:serine hydrolase [Longimicrobiaceae bacterium]
MTRRLASALLAALLVLVSAAACAAAPHAPSAPPAHARSDTAALRRALEGLMRDYPGTAGVSVRNLRTGESLSIRGGETFPSASLVKVPVLVALLDQVNRGTVRLDERMGMIERDRVGGSGILQYMQSGLPLTLGDAAWLMITLSDNTATNLLLDKLNVRTVWEKAEALGLPHTKIHSKTFLRSTSIAPDSSVKYGLGVAVPDEMVRLFTLLHEGKAVSPALDSLALAMLRANQDGSKLVRWLPADVPVAHKSGDVDRARNDCGIIYGPEAPVAVCVMTRENQHTTYAVDAPAHLLIGRIGREVFRHYNPDYARRCEGAAEGLQSPATATFPPLWRC